MMSSSLRCSLVCVPVLIVKREAAATWGVPSNPGAVGCASGAVTGPLTAPETQEPGAHSLYSFWEHFPTVFPGRVGTGFPRSLS